MSESDAPPGPSGVLVETRTLFMAADRTEGEALLERVMDAELSIVCHPDESRLTVCSHCAGTLVNPPEEPRSGAGLDDRWAEGRPCAVCAESDFPGQEMACVREHTSGATIHPDGRWMTSEDRQLSAFLTGLLALLERGDLESARAYVVNKLHVLDADG